MTILTASPTHSFGPVIVTGMAPSKTGLTVRVQLSQQRSSTYAPGTRPHFALQDHITGKEDNNTFSSTCRTSQRMHPDEAKKLIIGDTLPGHLVRTLTNTPRYPRQQPTYEGGYANSHWSAEYGPDVDLRS